VANDQLGGNFPQFFKSLAAHFREVFFRPKGKRPYRKVNGVYLDFLFSH
jgi:hypothetical protein